MTYRRQDRRRHPTISEFMTAAPATCEHDLSLEDARERMYINNIRHLVVTHGKEVVGVLSTRDIAMAKDLGLDPRLVQVETVMTPDPYTVSPGADVANVVAEMEGHRYGSAVVLEDGELVGMFTTTDALRVLRKLMAGRRIVEAGVVPTHVVKHSEARGRVVHRVRVSDAVSRPGVGPSPSVGSGFDPNSW
jgi:acetoin utilization protein AcuB